MTTLDLPVENIKLSKKEYDKLYYIRNKTRCLERGKRSMIKKRYGISLEEYEAYRLTFSEFCGICGKPEKQNRRLSLDHDHKTKRIRGLLCHNCNVAIGLLQESPELFRKALEYING